MSAKQYNLPPSVVIPTQAVSANKTSLVTNIFLKDNIAYGVFWTGTLAGTFLVEVSVDYDPHTLSGNWTSVPINPSVVAAGSPGSAYIELIQTAAPWVRLRLSYTSGSGNVTATIVGKGL